MKAHVYTPDGDGKPKIEEIPADLADAAKTAHETLVEMVAEGDDALMEEFFEKGTLPIEDLMKGLRDAFQAQAHLSGGADLGAAQHRQRTLLDLLADVFPDPAKRGVAIGHSEPGSKGNEIAAKNQRRRAGVDFRVQDAGRSVCRAHHLFQGDVRRAEERRHAAEFHARHERTPAARAGDARQDGDGGGRAARRGSGRHRQS